MGIIHCWSTVLLLLENSITLWGPTGKRDGWPKSMGQGPGLIPSNLGTSRRCCNEKAGVATRLLPAVEVPSEVTCNARGWLNHLQPPLLFEGAYWILLTGKEAYRDSTPNLGSSINCLKWRQIQVSHPAAGRGEAGRCMRESDMAAEGEE